jgi:uncharacterized protein
LKAVFDTNIFVSALAIPGGQAERAIDLVIDARVNLCISKEIIHEVLGVLAQKFSKGPEELARTAVFLSELAEVIVPRKKLAVLDDEPDNRILECAVTGHADITRTRMLGPPWVSYCRSASLAEMLRDASGRSAS